MVLILYMMEISSPCRAVLMTIKHIGIPVELRVEDMLVGDDAKRKEFSKINPRSCVPTIDDDGFCLWESRAIMTYLMNKYAPSSPLYPIDPKKRARVDMMLSYDQGSLYKSQVEYLYPLIYRGEPADFDKELNYQKSLLILDDTLNHFPFAAGKRVTLADLSILANISLAEVYDFNFDSFPNIKNWLNRMKRELPYHRDVNEIPLLQFKLWYRPAFENHSDEEELEIDETYF